MLTDISPSTKRLGFWSAVLATVFSITYDVGQVAERGDEAVIVAMVRSRESEYTSWACRTPHAIPVLGPIVSSACCQYPPTFVDQPKNLEPHRCRIRHCLHSLDQYQLLCSAHVGSAPTRCRSYARHRTVPVRAFRFILVLGGYSRIQLHECRHVVRRQGVYG